MASDGGELDPQAVILARIEVKLDGALREQERHGTTLERHDARFTSLETRVTVMEAQRASDSEHKTNGFTARQTFYFALSAFAAVAAVIVTILITTHH